MGHLDCFTRRGGVRYLVTIRSPPSSAANADYFKRNDLMLNEEMECGLRRIYDLDLLGLLEFLEYL